MRKWTKEQKFLLGLVGLLLLLLVVSTQLIEWGPIRALTLGFTSLPIVLVAWLQFKRKSDSV